MAETALKITVREHGPYVVEGGIPLVRKTPVVSEHGEPLTWKTGDIITSAARYSLCRCGLSKNKPFCDGTHRVEGFDGTETADPAPVASRQTDYPGTQIVVKNDPSLCIHAGFCGNRVSNVWQMTQDSADTQVRAQIIAMIERCPSGALSYSIAGEVIEPALPKEIALTPGRRPVGQWRHSDRTGGWPAVRGAQPRHPVPLRCVEKQTVLRWRA